MIILIAVSAIAILIAAESGSKEDVIVYTPDPITGETPMNVVQSYDTPSFFEIAKEKLGTDIIKKADIVIRFETYSESIVALNSVHHSFDIASAKNEDFTFDFNDISEMGYSYKRNWKEGDLYHWVYQYYDTSITAHPAILNVYKDGVLFDKVSITIADVETNNGMIRKEIVACESQKLTVVYYNLDTQE